MEMKTISSALNSFESTPIKFAVATSSVSGPVHVVVPTIPACPNVTVSLLATVLSLHVAVAELLSAFDLYNTFNTLPAQGTIKGRFKFVGLLLSTVLLKGINISSVPMSSLKEVFYMCISFPLILPEAVIFVVADIAPTTSKAFAGVLVPIPNLVFVGLIGNKVLPVSPDQ